MAESYFASNYEHLKRKNAAWAELVLAQYEGRSEVPKLVDNSSPDLLDAKNGQPNIMVKRNGEEIFYHSRYNPEKEAKDIVDNCYDSRQNYFTVLGMGMGYTTEALIDRAEGKIFVIEPNPEAFLKAMEHRDLSRILSSKRVALSVGQAWNEAFTGWVKMTTFHEISGVGIVELPGAMKAAPDGYFDHFKQKLKAYVVTLGGNLQTVMLKAWEYQRNTLISIPRILENPPIKMLFNSFEGKPAIIVSAGPSLSKNIDQLKDLKGRAVIIAVDTSLKPLLKEGIEPDFICTGDPQFANYKHLAGAKVKDAYLVAEPMTHPQSLTDFDGKLFIASFADKMMQWLTKSIGDVGHVMCWGSVATMAFDLARKLGCDPIIFTGQDLSFSGGRTYVEGTYFEDEEKKDMSTEAFAKREKTYEMEDIYGNQVKTNRQMFAYLNWFNHEISQTKAHVINATEGGILKDGVEILTLRETTEKYMSDSFDVKGTISDAKEGFEPYHLKRLAANLKEALESFERITRICNKGLDRVQRTLMTLRELIHYPAKLCGEEIHALDTWRLKMATESAMKDFIEFANQTGMLNFVRKYNDIQGSKFSNRVMDDAMDLYADLYFSTRRCIGTVRPFFEHALKMVQEREGRNE